MRRRIQPEVPYLGAGQQSRDQMTRFVAQGIDEQQTHCCQKNERRSPNRYLQHKSPRLVWRVLQTISAEAKRCFLLYKACQYRYS